VVASGVKFEFQVDGEAQLVRALSRYGDKIGDMTPYFRSVAKLLSQIIRQQFDSEGGRTDAWRPLSPEYAAWKMRQVGSKPILVFSGRLRRSLVDKGEGGIEDIGRDGLRWGTGVPYAIYHQRPTGGKSPRRIIDLTEGDREAIMKMLQRFFAEGPKEFGL